MRRYWSSRLNGGYNLTNIFIRESPYDPLDQNNPNYTESIHDDNDTNWGLGLLFEESVAKKIDNTSWMEETDDLVLTKLFN